MSGPALRSGATNGFSLSEMLIVLAVSVTVGIILAGIMVNNTKFSYQQGSLIGNGLSLNDVMAAITSNIKQAAYVSVGYPESFPVYITGSSTLVLKTLALSESGVIPDKYDYFVVSADSAKPSVLHQRVFADPNSLRKSSDQILTTILDSITFKYYDKNSVLTQPGSANGVEINLTVSSQVGQNGAKNSATLKTTLRNN